MIKKQGRYMHGRRPQRSYCSCESLIVDREYYEKRVPGFSWR